MPLTAPKLRSRRRVKNLWPSLMVVIIGGIATVGAGYGIHGAYLNHRLYREAQRAVATRCRIERAEVRREVHTDSDGDESSCYRPSVTYLYPDGEGERGGSTISPYDGALESICDETLARAAIAPYRAGMSLRCWVDPRDRSRAYLDRSFRLTNLAQLLVTFPLALLGLLLVAIAFSPRRKPGTPPAKRAFEEVRGRRHRLLLRQRYSRESLLLIPLCLYAIGVGSLYIFLPGETGGYGCLVLSLLGAIASLGFLIYWLLYRHGARIDLYLREEEPTSASPSASTSTPSSAPRLLRGHPYPLLLRFAGLRAGQRLEVTLRAREVAFDKEGTLTQRVFFEEELLSFRPERSGEQELELCLPERAMCSLRSEVGGIEWSVDLRIRQRRAGELLLSAPLEVEA